MDSLIHGMDFKVIHVQKILSSLAWLDKEMFQRNPLPLVLIVGENALIC